MYEINGKFGQVRLCRTNLTAWNSIGIPPVFSFRSGGWHRCNDLYYIQRPHGNDTYLVFFSLTAGGCIRIYEKYFDIPASSIVIVPPDTPHEYFTKSGENWEFYWFHALPPNMRILDDLIRIRGHIFPFSKTARAGKLLENLFPERTDPDMAQFQITSSKVLSDIMHLLMEASIASTSDTGKNRGILSSVLREIEENYSEELNITALAAEHFVSQQHLIRLFRTATGYTPYEYLKKHRLKKSIDLLTYSDASVETISGMVGFSGVSNYIYQFRNEYGITPSKYRKYFY